MGDMRDHCSSVARQVQEEPRNLWDAMQRDWLPIEDRTFDFDVRARKIKFLQTCTLADLHSLVENSVKTAAKIFVLVRSRKNGGALPPAGAERTARKVYRGSGMAEFRDSFSQEGIDVWFQPTSVAA